MPPRNPTPASRKIPDPIMVVVLAVTARVKPEGSDSLIGPDVPAAVDTTLAIAHRVLPTVRYFANVRVLAMFVLPCRSCGVKSVQASSRGASSFKLSRTFVFQNAAVSTSPEGVEGRRRGRGVGYDSAYE